MGDALPNELTPGEELDGRTRFHRFRYHIARGFIDPLDKVLDLGCGLGYGSDMMSEITLDVYGYDMDKDNISYAVGKHKGWGAQYKVANLEEMEIPKAEVAVSFEVIEHLYAPKEFVTKLKQSISKYIIVSVPIGQKLAWDEELQEYHEENDVTHKSVFDNTDDFKNMFLDENWKEFASFYDRPTLICIFYNKNYIA